MVHQRIESGDDDGAPSSLATATGGEHLGAPTGLRRRTRMIPWSLEDCEVAAHERMNERPGRRPTPESGDTCSRIAWTRRGTAEPVQSAIKPRTRIPVITRSAPPLQINPRIDAGFHLGSLTSERIEMITPTSATTMAAR